MWLHPPACIYFPNGTYISLVSSFFSLLFIPVKTPAAFRWLSLDMSRSANTNRIIVSSLLPSRLPPFQNENYPWLLHGDIPLRYRSLILISGHLQIHYMRRVIFHQISIQIPMGTVLDNSDSCTGWCLCALLFLGVGWTSGWTREVEQVTCWEKNHFRPWQPGPTWPTGMKKSAILLSSLLTVKNLDKHFNCGGIYWVETLEDVLHYLTMHKIFVLNFSVDMFR